MLTYELVQAETYNNICATSKETDQSGQPQYKQKTNSSGSTLRPVSDYLR